MKTFNRWDRLLERKPVPLIDHLLDEVSQLFARELDKWPLEIEVFDAAGVLPADAPRPSDTVFREAFRLARFDMSREVEAYDDYMRNLRFLECGLIEADRPALLFLSRYLGEQLLGLREATEGRVTRDDLCTVLGKTEHCLLKLRSRC